MGIQLWLLGPCQFEPHQKVKNKQTEDLMLLWKCSTAYTVAA